MPADLHIHTNLSDGALSPEEIIQKAHKAGLTIIAITDHDNVDAIDRAASEGGRLGVKVIPGIEFTTDIPDNEIHILGYYIDHKAQWLLDLLARIREDRVNRVYKTIEKLKKLGITMDAEDVFKLVDKGSVGRPHIARVLIQMGIVRNIQEAFNRFLDFHAPAYVPHYKLTPQGAIETIIKAGGVPVYAHPGASNNDGIIKELVSHGLAGIEVFYLKHSDSQTKHYKGLAEEYGLLMTGGSDFHGLGTGRDVSLGDMKLPDTYIKLLEEYKHHEAARSNIR